MRRSDQPIEKQAERENEAHGKPKGKRTTNIAMLDNDTMIEAFKYLNYCGLANNSLVSKKFCNVIQTYRHKLALLYVDRIEMECVMMPPTAVKIFGKWLSPEEYTEWIVRNGYSKQVSLDSQIVLSESTHDRKVYYLIGSANYNDPIHRRIGTKTTVFFTRAKLNHETWPLFQHFVRLLTDPFVSIRWIELTAQNDVLNLLTGAMNQYHGRIQCQRLTGNIADNTQNFISWIKNHVCCYEFHIWVKDSSSNYDEELLDFFATGNRCTSAITIRINDLSAILTDLVQTFMDLKNCDGNQMVEFIQGQVTDQSFVELLKRNFASFILKDGMDGFAWTTIFQFINNDVGKKLQLSVRIPSQLSFLLEIKNL